MSIAIISIFIITVVVAVVTVVMTGLKGRGMLSVGKKNKAAVIREATKRLAQNPNDSAALLMVGGSRLGKGLCFLCAAFGSDERAYPIGAI